MKLLKDLAISVICVVAAAVLYSVLAVLLLLLPVTIVAAVVVAVFREADKELFMENMAAVFGCSQDPRKVGLVVQETVENVFP